MFKNLLNAIRPRAAAASVPSPADEEAKALIRSGNAAEDAGRVQEALATYERAAALAPGLPAAHLNIGIAREALGQVDAARAAYEHVLALDAAHPFGAYNLGKLEYLAQRLPEAETLLRRALASRPDFPDALVLLASVCDATGQLEAAADALGEALRLKPDYAGALYNQADVLRKLNRLDAAEVAARRAAELAPERPEHHARLADVLYLQGFPDEALVPLRRAIALAPGELAWRSQELFSMTLCGELPPQALFDRHQALGRDIENAVPARAHAPRARRERLRVGFVSEDFRVHPTALFLMPVLDHIARDRFEVFGYSSWARPDHITQWLRERSDHWLDTSRLRDPELAEAIAADGIDVLVDLNGHTSGGRLGAFAAKPAPVQLGWVGYLNTTGLTRMDFRLTDRRCDPPDPSQAWHTERLLYLPESQWCYRPFIEVEGAAAAPCERNGFITFGSLNNVSKLTPEMAACWGRILAAVPDSRLLVADVASARKREALLAAIEGAGVGRDRVEFAPRADLENYYRLMDRIDIALDSHPYGGGTTTFDALWMGVPVVTAAGRYPASRSASSVLAALGLDAWIAAGLDGFVQVAVARAQDVAAIAELRRTLRARLQASPLMDEPAFVRAFEVALEEAWSLGR
jgi:predicted O-linked N-acetylglucosamine transferase (SPINDLY family)